MKRSELEIAVSLNICSMPPPAPLVSFALALCVFLDAASGAKPLWSYLRDGGTHVFGPSHYAERLWSRVRVGVINTFLLSFTAAHSCP